MSVCLFYSGNTLKQLEREVNALGVQVFFEFDVYIFEFLDSDEDYDQGQRSHQGG